MKAFKYVVIAVFVILFASQVWAIHLEVPEKPSTLIIFKNDIISPEKGDNVVCQNFFAYWKKNSLGLGIETNLTLKTDYLQLKPIVTYEVAKGISLVAGGATDSVGKDFVDAGVWFNTNVGKANVFVDLRNYWGLNAKSLGYADSFLEVTYPVNEKFSLGVNAVYDHWWESGNSWVLAGPVVYYKASQIVTIFARVSREWAIADETSAADRYRLGLKFVF